MQSWGCLQCQFRCSTSKQAPNEKSPPHKPHAGIAESNAQQVAAARRNRATGPDKKQVST